MVSMLTLDYSLLIFDSRLMRTSVKFKTSQAVTFSAADVPAVSWFLIIKQPQYYSCVNAGNH